MERYQRVSVEWEQAVRVKSIKAATFKETGEVLGTSSTTVMRRFDRLAKSEIKPIERLPKVIAMDEYKGDTREGKFQLIIADGETREPLEILPNRSKKTVKRYLQKHGQDVEIVIMDMSPTFKAAVQQALDQPLIVADRFHFTRYVNWAVDKVRRREQQQFTEYDRKKCKRMRHVMHKAHETLTEQESWYLNRYLNLSADLRNVYELKESYQRWFKNAKKIGSSNIRQVKVELDSFYRQVEEIGIPEMKRTKKTFENWETEILNSFVFNYSNGFLEGINNLTKVMKRNAFGYQRFDRFRARILLRHQYKKIGKHVG